MRDAIQALTGHLREHPADTAQRTFLFELLCFAGEYTRAEKQLAVLAGSGIEGEMGAIVYYAALHAEKNRHALFETKEFPQDAAISPRGELNGQPFTDLRDADPNIGARLEVFAAGAAVWISFEHVASLDMEAPHRLRDTLWAPAQVTTAATFSGRDLGDVLIPALYPFSWKHPDEAVWLGRITTWVEEKEGLGFPAGQKTWLVDGEEFPFLEVRTLRFYPAADTDAGTAEQES
ncbi:MAG: type VI secretion system accessory protein TagJ [Acidobacteriaceae bacterium]